ncbi:MAG: zinc ribbon domain-containing protein [Firmicutes bacterium]|nr:zinc ribbon domain-containing protein [Bacillota bacterium]
MFCENCGKQVPNGATFCAACGAKVNVPQQPNFNSQMNYGGQMPYGTVSPYYNKHVSMEYEIQIKKEEIAKVAKSEKRLGIGLIIWGALQAAICLNGVLMIEGLSNFWIAVYIGTVIAGIASIYYGAVSVKYSSDIYFENYRIISVYEERLAELIIFMIFECVLGGIIGICLSVSACINRSKILKAKDIMMQNVSKETYSRW